MKCYQEIPVPATVVEKLYKESSVAHTLSLCRTLMPEKGIYSSLFKYQAYKLEVKKRIIDMTANSSGIRNISKVLGISKQKVILLHESFFNARTISCETKNMTLSYHTSCMAQKYKNCYIADNSICIDFTPTRISI